MQDYTNIHRETKSFVVHESTMRAASHLSDKDLGRLTRQFFDYVREGKMPEEKNVALIIVFEEWLLRYEYDKHNYEQKTEQRSKAGRKAMAKRWSKTDHHEITKDNTVITKDNTVITEDNTVITEDNTPIANITDIDNDIEIGKETSPEGEAKKRVSLSRSHPLQERQEAFYESMQPYRDQYDREMLNDFYQYWTEQDKRRHRMRFEMQKTWETGKRLALWNRKSFR